MTKTILHNIIDDYFAEQVEINENSGLVCYDSFLRVWEYISSSLSGWGVNYTINEIMDNSYRGEIWDEEQIHDIESYIKDVLEPKYRRWSTPTTQRGF